MSRGSFSPGASIDGFRMESHLAGGWSGRRSSPGTMEP